MVMFGKIRYFYVVLLGILMRKFASRNLRKQKHNIKIKQQDEYFI